MKIDDVALDVLEALREHAAQECPRESCGVVVIWKGRQRYVPCRNIADKSENFVIHPEDFAAAEHLGETVLIVHSHPYTAPLPSDADLTMCERTAVPWLIVNWPTGAVHIFNPSGYKAPLIGRQFSHGVLDCYALVKDFYERELKIVLPEFEREELWWEKGQNLYLENFQTAGFSVVSDLQQYDAFLMMVGSPVPNHAAIYLGDGFIMHHLLNRLSSRDVYGGWYQKITVKTLRHKDLAK